jgi:hypothetical protein
MRDISAMETAEILFILRGKQGHVSYVLVSPSQAFSSISNNVGLFKFSSPLLVCLFEAQPACLSAALPLVYSATHSPTNFYNTKTTTIAVDRQAHTYPSNSRPFFLTIFVLLCLHLQDDHRLRLTNRILFLTHPLSNRRRGCDNRRLTILTRGARLTMCEHTNFNF